MEAPGSSKTAGSSGKGYIIGGIIVRTAVLILAGVLFSGSAWATEWTLIRDDAKSGEKAYIDKSRVIRRGSLAAMWLLTNYERPKGVARKAHLSEKALVEYDCENHDPENLSLRGIRSMTERVTWFIPTKTWAPSWQSPRTLPKRPAGKLCANRNELSLIFYWACARLGTKTVGSPDRKFAKITNVIPFDAHYLGRSSPPGKRHRLLFPQAISPIRAAGHHGL